MFGRRADLMLVDLVWWRCHVLVLGGIGADGFGGRKVCGSRADFMLAKLAWLRRRF